MRWLMLQNITMNNVKLSVRLLTIIIIKKYISKNHALCLDQLWYSVFLVDDMKVKYKSGK